MAVTIPAGLEARADRDPESAAWLRAVPSVVCELSARWALSPAEYADSPEGTCAWVGWVTRAGGTPAVLKLGIPHMEGAHEIDGLEFWNGDPTVELLEADRSLGALLIERCDPGTPLRDLPESDQDVVLGGLLRRLWREPKPGHVFRSLAFMLEDWIAHTERQIERWPDAGLVHQGIELLRELPTTAAVERVLATDLHAGNVLRARREPWLVIDPKPFVGDPAYDLTQHLLNCPRRLQAEPETTIHRVADLAGVDAERVRLWTFARIAGQPRDDRESAVPLDLARRLAP